MFPQRPAWLPPEAARIIADAAGEVLRRRGGPEEAKAAARAAAVGCLPSLPAPMLTEAVAAVVPVEAPPLSQEPSSLVSVEPADLARRIGFLAGGTNRAPGVALERLASRLADSGAVRISKQRIPEMTTAATSG